MDIRRHLVAFAFFALFTHSSDTLAESGSFNLHLELGPNFALTGWQGDEYGTGFFTDAKFELALRKWVGIGFGLGYSKFFRGEHPEGYVPIDKTDMFIAGLGIRLRPFNDEKGYRWPWKPRPDHMGNLWGNLWFDLNLDLAYSGKTSHFAMDFGFGSQLSIINGFQVGPVVRAMYTHQPDSINARDSADLWTLMFGLGISMAIPPTGMVMPDSDKDGFYDPMDICPDEAEDKDGFEDEDGCPDTDNDSDKVPDAQDKCTNEPEDLDSYKDNDGCPDTDNDQDAIADKNDGCPHGAEDYDNFEDEDGCPDTDNDGDGVPDTKDNCPESLENLNGYQDDDGCPEPDKDNDGFLDDRDKCPLQPETVNGVEDDDGCPDKAMVEVKKNKIWLGDKIYFGSGNARVRGKSKDLVRQLATLIKAHPEYARISIEGHADKTGKEKYNMRLSKQRADRVKKLLSQYGVDKNRLVTKGFGESDPWKDSLSKNRRVEFVILGLDESLATSPVAPDTRNAAPPMISPANENTKGVELWKKRKPKPLDKNPHE